MLRFAVDTADPANGALLQRVQERGTAIETQLLFFELEWAALERRARRGAAGRRRPRHARATTCAPRAATARTCSPSPRRRSWPRSRSRGRDAWSRLFSEVTSAIKVDARRRGRARRARRRARAPDVARPRAARRTSPSASPRRWSRRCASRGYIFNTLMADKATDDRLRAYPTWISSAQPRQRGQRRVGRRRWSRRSASAYEIPRRWYRLKARLLGVDRLADYDRMASVGARTTSPIELGRGQATSCLDSFGDFSAVLADARARASSTSDWIDAPVAARQARRRVLRLHRPERPPVRDAQLHRAAPRRADARPRARPRPARLPRPATRGVFEQHTPLTLAETASVFGETLVFRAPARRRPQTPESRLALLAENIEGSIATVFRQVAMNRFEDLAHTARRSEGELQRRPHRRAVGAVPGGAARRRRRGHRRLPDVVVLRPPLHRHARATCTPTPTASCWRCGSTASYLDEGESFVPALPRAAQRRRSQSPEELAAIAGLDLADPGFWRAGLDLVKAQLEQAEAAAEEVRWRG